MATIRFQPLSKWPYPESDNRKYAQFKASYADTLGTLDIELDRIRAEKPVLELDFAPGAVDQRGFPKLNQKARSSA